MKGSLYNFDETLFEKNETEELIDTYKRVNALQWACNLGDEKCVNYSKFIFEKWKNDNSNV